MSSEYKNNHYVPVWYQKRFLLPNARSNELFYLDLKPGTFTDPRGVVHDHWAVKRKGLRSCFAEDDLYSTRFGVQKSTQLEKLFFGTLDAREGEPRLGISLRSSTHQQATNSMT